MNQRQNLIIQVQILTIERRSNNQQINPTESQSISNSSVSFGPQHEPHRKLNDNTMKKAKSTVFTKGALVLFAGYLFIIFVKFS